MYPALNCPIPTKIVFLWQSQVQWNLQCSKIKFYYCTDLCWDIPIEKKTPRAIFSFTQQNQWWLLLPSLHSLSILQSTGYKKSNKTGKSSCYHYINTPKAQFLCLLIYLCIIISTCATQQCRSFFRVRQSHKTKNQISIVAYVSVESKTLCSLFWIDATKDNTYFFVAWSSPRN